MRRSDLTRIFAWLALTLTACRQAPADDTAIHRVTPAPLPPTPAEPAPQPVNEPAPSADPTPPPSAATRDQPVEPAAPRAQQSARSKPVAAKPARAPSASAKQKPTQPAPAAPAPVAAERIEPPPEPESVPSEPPPAPPPPPKPPTRVIVPSTARVHVEVPPGLQRWLDADTRMQPWLNKVIGVIDGCYANVVAGSPGATGTITFKVTMHENARPDPDIQSLPGALSGVVTCATGQLMRTKMPLFTGTEGETYVVRVKFGD